ncbi:MAG: GFA family protein, partial [Reyranella sp.]
MSANMRWAASCLCGGVEIEATGAPITSSVCYCADCQRGSRQIEDLPNAGPVREADGGTAYILFRKDR